MISLPSEPGASAVDAERLLNAVETVGLLVVGPGGELVFANARIASLWAVPLETGAPWSLAFPDGMPEEVARATQACLDKGQTVSVPDAHGRAWLPLSQDHGLHQWLIFKPFPLEDGARGCLIEVRQDQGARGGEHGATGQALRDIVIAAASHDLRNPLLRIQSSVEIAREELDETGVTLSAEVVQAFDWINASAEALKAHLDTLMHYSRLEAQAMPPTPLDIARILRDVLAADPLPEGTSIEVARDLPRMCAPEPAMVLVLRSLITHFLPHLGRAGRTLRLEGGREATMDWVHLVDPGPGAAGTADDHGPERRPGDGGLGISLAQGVIHSLGGDLVIAERPDGRSGTMFRLSLPRCLT